MTLCLGAPPFTVIHFEETDCEEPLGSKEKAWATFDKSSWLFKHPRASGEHWAEKIACEVAGLLGIPHANVELATLKDERGVASQDILGRGESLIHGNELLSALVEQYDVAKKWKQTDHSLENIWESIELRVYFCEEAKQAFAGYIVLDALVGNADRHHENWAFVRNGQCRYRLAESYDHGSSLGRELRDESRKLNCRSKILELGTMQRYLQRAKGSIYWDSNSLAPSPIGLVGEAWKDPRFRAYLDPWIDKLGDGFVRDVGKSIERIPETWMSPLAREFAQELLRCGVETLGAMTGRW